MANQVDGVTARRRGAFESTPVNVDDAFRVVGEFERPCSTDDDPADTQPNERCTRPTPVSSVGEKHPYIAITNLSSASMNATIAAEPRAITAESRTVAAEPRTDRPTPWSAVTVTWRWSDP